MANWRYTVDIKDLHDAYKRGDLLPIPLGKAVADRLMQFKSTCKPPLPPQYCSELDRIIDNFQTIDDDIDEYDSILNLLYDWADQSLPCSPNTPFSARPKLCWVKTLF